MLNCLYVMDSAAKENVDWLRLRGICNANAVLSGGSFSQYLSNLDNWHLLPSDERCHYILGDSKSHAGFSLVRNYLGEGSSSLIRVILSRDVWVPMWAAYTATISPSQPRLCSIAFPGTTGFFVIGGRCRAKIGVLYSRSLWDNQVSCFRWGDIWAISVSSRRRSNHLERKDSSTDFEFEY